MSNPFDRHFQNWDSGDDPGRRAAGIRAPYLLPENISRFDRGLASAGFGGHGACVRTDRESAHPSRILKLTPYRSLP